MRIICVITAFFIVKLAWGQTATGTLKITRLTGNFYVCTTFNDPGDGSSFPSNSMYLVTNNGVVLFDTPWDTTMFQPLLDSIETRHHKKVIACIATHFHADRTAGLEYYKQKGIKTYTSIKTDKLSAARHQKRAQYLISGDTSFNIGGYRFQIYYPGEGHSPDNIVAWFAKEKILYGGCLIKSAAAKSLGNLGDANTNAYPATLRNLQNKFRDPVFIIPGHQDWTNNNSIQHTLNLLAGYNKLNSH
jgi:metallo-beta-lactamase class B